MVAVTVAAGVAVQAAGGTAVAAGIAGAMSRAVTAVEGLSSNVPKGA
jgi:hypothetical protein